MSSKKDKCKETHVKTHYSLFIKSKGQRILKAAKEKQLIIRKVSPTKLTAGSYQKPWRPDENMIFLKKRGTKKPVSQKYYIQQNYLSKNEGEMKTLPDKKNTKGKSLLLTLPYKKC